MLPAAYSETLENLKTFPCSSVLDQNWCETHIYGWGFCCRCAFFSHWDLKASSCKISGKNFLCTVSKQDADWPALTRYIKSQMCSKLIDRFSVMLLLVGGSCGYCGFCFVSSNGVNSEYCCAWENSNCFMGNVELVMALMSNRWLLMFVAFWRSFCAVKHQCFLKLWSYFRQARFRGVCD